MTRPELEVKFSGARVRTGEQRAQDTEKWRSICAETWGDTKSPPGNHPEDAAFPPHGVQVDRDIKPILERMWELGVQTFYSCQGSYRGEENVWGFEDGYISYDHRGHLAVVQVVEEFGLQSPVYENDGTRWVVRFAPIYPGSTRDDGRHG